MKAETELNGKLQKASERESIFKECENTISADDEEIAREEEILLREEENILQTKKWCEQMEAELQEQTSLARSNEETIQENSRRLGVLVESVKSRRPLLEKMERGLVQDEEEIRLREVAISTKALKKEKELAEEEGRKKLRDLEREMKILNERIGEIRTEVEEQRKSIEPVQLEMQAKEANIKEREDRLASQPNRPAEELRRRIHEMEENIDAVFEESNTLQKKNEELEISLTTRFQELQHRLQVLDDIERCLEK